MPEVPSSRGDEEKAHATLEWKPHRWLGYEILNELPHDTEAFTQGILLSNGEWIESTGGYGTSSIRRADKSTGKVILKRNLSRKYFGEGITELNGKLFQLTWRNQLGFIYDARSLRELGTFKYKGEGWGITTDGESLIVSNGSDRLQFLDPNTFRVKRELSVRHGSEPVELINELEFVEGEIFANVWHTEKVVRIDPMTGTVIGVIDLSGIDAKEKRKDPEHVSNGIAYDPAARELYVTGKCWPKIYQIRLVRME